MKMMTHTTAMMTVLLRYSQTLTQIQMTLCTTVILRVTVPLDWNLSVLILTLHDLLYSNDDSFIMILSDFDILTLIKVSLIEVSRFTTLAHEFLGNKNKILFCFPEIH